MRTPGLQLLLALAIGGITAHAATVYSNPAVGSPETAFFSVGPYIEIGDQIQLAGTARSATQATVQLYNPGAAGTFDAILRFYAVGAPVGAPISPDYTLLGQTAPASSDFLLVFPLAAFVAPDNLIFTLEIQNTSAALDLGLDLYNPPSIGSSDASFLVVRPASFSQLSGLQTANLYFQLEADPLGGAPVPEPGTLALSALALSALLLLAKPSQS
ncbi:hypothetical protein [Paludibaculum fermentans]|uniref:hypothetical protein n=1 Tax=Paludibaculum fermentans TaxID=1473598 RepID=UPI003EBE5BBF